jgi:branched-chain amino acid transport system substrate-binding protein
MEEIRMLSQHSFTRRALVVAIGLVCLVTAGCSSNGKTKSSESASASTAPALTKSALKLGTMGDLSGVGAVQAVQAINGVKAWAKWVNTHGGVSGHPVDLIVKDDAGDPARGLANVKELVESDHVLALVGVHTNSTEPSWASYVATKGIPVVGGESDTTVWIQNPMFFVSGEPGVNTLISEAYLAKAAGFNKFGSINVGQVQDTGPLIQILTQATASYGLKYPYHITVSGSAPNYTAQCLALRQADVEVVALNLDQNTRTRLTNDCFKQNIKPSYLVPSGAYTPDILKLPQFEGAVVPMNNFLWTTDQAVAVEFRDAMKAYFPKTDLSPSVTQGWSGGKLFQAAGKNLPDTPTTQDVLAGLYALTPNDTLDGVSPGATFTKGKPATVTACFFLAKVVKGDLTAPQGDKPVCPTS